MIAEQLAGNLIQGLILGSVYGMATMGLSLIFGVLKVVNVGHGALIMVGAFTALWFFQAIGLNPLLAVPFAFLIGMGLGFAFYYTAIKRLIKAPELATLLATFSIGILLQEIVKLGFGSEFRGYNWVVGKLDLGVTVVPGGLAWIDFLGPNAPLEARLCLYAEDGGHPGPIGSTIYAYLLYAFMTGCDPRELPDDPPLGPATGDLSGLPWADSDFRALVARMQDIAWTRYRSSRQEREPHDRQVPEPR